MGILLILFSALMLSSVLGETLRFEILKGAFIKPIDILVFLTALFWFVKKIMLGKTKAIYKDSLFVPIVLFFIVGLFSLIINVKNLSIGEFFISFTYALRWILYGVIYFVVKDLFSKNSRNILWLTAICGSLILILGFIQYFFYSNLSNLYYLGWDEHMHRLFSVYLDPNFAGSFFVLFLIFVSGVTLYFVKNKQKKLYPIFCLLGTISLAAVYLTYSRSALIMLIVSAIVFLFLFKKMKWILFLIVISILFFAISSRSFNTENINPFKIGRAHV